MRNFCTYFDIQYLDRGLALHESMQAHCQPFHLWMLALCGEVETALRRLELPDVTVVSMAEFETDALRAAKANRSRPDYIWTCVGPWMQWLFRNVPDMAELNCLDADCYFYADPAPVFAEIGRADVAIAPHRFSPDRRWMAARNGLYNCGFIHVKRTRDGLACLQEWAGLCLARCVQSEGANQRYWDGLVAKYNVHPIAHKGANLAPWNQAEQYCYSLRNGQIYVDNDPLMFFHFHKRLEPGFELDLFVQRYIYGPYRTALSRADRRISRLG